MMNLIGSILSIIGRILIFITISIWLMLLIPLIITGWNCYIIEVHRMYDQAQKTCLEYEILQNIRSRLKKYPQRHAHSLTGNTLNSLTILLIKSYNLITPVLNIKTYYDAI
ncbi:MAG: hypothetical protein KKC68_01115 [Candidatus Thermoplasmatota archaeon]|nr:hypothetical protein [Candidatus Thermoplasmatota archaeon]MBU1940350.1 hypothetical protein [Candidatus Thermoplasmatota archaeon]